MINYLTILFSIWVLIVIGYQAAQLFSSAEMGLKKIQDMAQAEYVLRKCAEIKAVEANLIDAGEYLKGKFPDQEAKFGHEIKRVTASLLSHYGNNVAEDFSKVCQNKVLPHLYMEIHKEENPDVPKSWPNRVARFYKKEE